MVTSHLAWATMVLAASMATASAGPCASDIDALQARIDAALDAKAAAGPPARQGGFAGMSEQPTPRSMANAEVKLGELSPRTVAVIRHAMVRARAADAAGKTKSCEQALARVRRAMRR